MNTSHKEWGLHSMASAKPSAEPIYVHTDQGMTSSPPTDDCGPGLENQKGKKTMLGF